MSVPTARAQASQSIRESPLGGTGNQPNVPFGIERDVTQYDAKGIFGKARVTLGQTVYRRLIPHVYGTTAYCFSGTNVARSAGQEGRYTEDVSRDESPQKNLAPITSQNGIVHESRL